LSFLQDYFLSVAGAASSVAGAASSVAGAASSVAGAASSVVVSSVAGVVVSSVALLPQAANVKAAQAAKAKVIFFIFLLVNLIECAAKINRKTYTAKHYLFFFEKS